jgi:TadE-like protein
MTGKGLFKDRRGTTAVEFALTAPVFLLMLFGLWQIGYGLWWQFGLQHGAQMAARYASVTLPRPSDSAIKTYAASQSYGLNPSPSIFIVSNPTCGNQIAVINYPVSPIVAIPVIPALTLNAQACYAT